MKLDRNINADGSGRYALIDLRKLRALLAGNSMSNSQKGLVEDVVGMLNDAKVLNYGEVGSEHEFVPLMLKDINTEAALIAYANSADSHDVEFANEFREMAKRAGNHHPNCKIPD